MNNAALFHQYSEISRRDSLQALQDFADIFNWRPDGRDSVLDAGCGPGDITSSILLPFLPPKFERLVGVDISEKMIDYARQTYAHPKLSFHHFNMDMALDEQPFGENNQTFDHIFSSYCLMWISKPKICLANFYKLLKPGGDILLIFTPRSPTRDIYKDQKENTEWGKYIPDMGKIISPYHYWENPAEEFQKLLTEAGFSNCDVRTYDKGYNRSFEAMKSKKYFCEFYMNFGCVKLYTQQNTFSRIADAFEAVNPFVDRIPDDEKQNYLDDFMQRMADKCQVYGDLNQNKDGCRLTFPYRLLVAYARK